MSNGANKYKVISLAMLFSAIVLAVARIIVLMDSVEINDAYTDSHYLINVNASTVSFVVVFLLIALLASIYLCVKFKSSDTVFEALRPGSTVDLSVYPPSVLFTTALSGFMLLSSGVYYIYLYIFDNSISAAFLVLAIMLVISSVGFIYSAFIAKGKIITSKAVWFKIVPVFMSIYWLMYEFIGQKQYQVNSSSAIHILGLICLMMFFAHDAINASGKGTSKVYFVSALLSVLFMFVDALPNLLLSCFWMFKLDVSILLYAVEIVLSLYAFSKVFTATSRIDIAKD